MSLKAFLKDPAWDSPFFKQLASNDTHQTGSHQGGMAFPKDLRRYLPSLDASETSALSPTTERILQVEIYIGTDFKLFSPLRYQFQTWSGERSPESRLTKGFSLIGKAARAGDIVVFQRRADVLDVFRLMLIKRETSEFHEIEDYITGRKWGALDENHEPVTQDQISEAKTELADLAVSPFVVQREIVPRTETRQRRIARSSVFSAQVGSQYSKRCAVSGIILATPTLRYEIEAAHVVPVSDRGSDDIRNGFALTQTLHWAFDRGLFGVKPDRTVYIPRKVKEMDENGFIRGFEGREIGAARSKSLNVHPDAFAWHFANKVAPWD